MGRTFEELYKLHASVQPGNYKLCCFIQCCIVLVFLMLFLTVYQQWHVASFPGLPWFQFLHTADYQKLEVWK